MPRLECARDEHELVLARIRETIGEEFEIIGIAENGNQAIDFVLTLDADVLVIGISMPVLNELKAAKWLQRANCRTKIVFSVDPRRSRFCCIRILLLGRPRTSLNPGSTTDLVPAIREALLGKTFVSQTQKL